jgi:hypothetical protein
MPSSPDLSELQNQVFELVRRSQEAILDAGRSFADNVTTMAPGDSEAIDKLLDDSFEFTEKVLKSQRDFAKSVVKAVTSPVTGGGGDASASDDG